MDNSGRYLVSKALRRRYPSALGLAKKKKNKTQEQILENKRDDQKNSRVDT